jgi:hypothetical protein
MLLFWLVTPCELVGRYQRFGEKYTVSIFSPEDWTRSHNSKEHLHRRENLKSQELR